MTLHSAFTFFLALFLFSITPGPGVFAILARALTRGANACVLLALGMVVSDLVYLVLATYGLAAIAENWAGLFTVIRYLGAAYLMYLGIRMFRAAVSDREPLAADTEGGGGWSGFMQGFLISASNPKVILFYIAFLPTFVNLSALSTSDLLLVCVLTALALSLGLMLIAVSAARAARVLKTPKAVRRLNRSAGGIMMAAGAYLAVSK
ncbi:threonine transporter [Saccharospirillum sp. MSK14-1]|uniref:LysE family translocator n=1 Tax=Saccharospirillum sp. MSK14-1 TaxID=1897632 RepID=UPI000D340151|nr:LysE family translocator [Saccharospirillum sp. MSK14-1]PTY35974.1 threonine transporter [Saccharospirillum sp. MSK14-1]